MANLFDTATFSGAFGGTIVPPPTGTASSDNGSLQGALNAAGIISAESPGTYTISQTLIIPSFTRLILGPNTTIKLANNVNTTMLLNANAQSTVWSVSSISAAAPGGIFTNPKVLVTVTTTATHNIKAGGFALIKGDTTGIFNGIWLVLSVTATTFVFLLSNSVANVGTGGGAMTAAVADGDIIVEGGTWDGNGESQLGIGANYYNGFGLYFNKVRNVHLRDMVSKDSFLQGAFWQNAYHCSARRCELRGSQGFQVLGPVTDFVFEDINGDCTDDMVSCGTYSQPPYTGNSLPAGDQGGGDVRSVTMRNITSYSNEGSGIAAVYQANGLTNQSFQVTDILAENIRSVSKALNSVGVACASASSATFGKVRIRNVHGNYTGYAISLRGASQTFTGTISNGSGGAGNTLTVTVAPASGGIATGQTINGSGTACVVTGYLTGTGGVGTYTVNGAAQNVSATSYVATSTFDDCEIYGVYGEPGTSSAHEAVDLQFAAWNNIEIDKVRLQFDQTAGAVYAVNCSNTGCAGDVLSIEDFYCTANGATHGCGIVGSVSGNTLNRLNADDITFGTAVGLINSPGFTNTVSVAMENVRCNGGLCLVAVGSVSMNIHADNCQALSATQAAFNFFGSSGTINLETDGLEITNCNLGINWGTAGGTVNLFGTGFIMGGGSGIGSLVSSGTVSIANPDFSLGAQSPAYAASYTPNLGAGPLVKVGTLSAAMTVNNPTNVPIAGTTVVFYFLENGTGSFNVSWGTNYIFGTAWTNTGNGAAKRSQVTFMVEPNGLLVAQNVNSWY